MKCLDFTSRTFQKFRVLHVACFAGKCSSPVQVLEAAWSALCSLVPPPCIASRRDSARRAMFRGLAIRLPPPRSYYGPRACLGLETSLDIPLGRLATHTHTCAIGRWACFYLLIYCSAPSAMIHATLPLGMDPIGENEISLDLQRLVAYVCLRPMAMLRPCTLRHAPSVRPCVRRGCVFKWHRPSFETTWQRRWPPRSSPC